MSVNHKDIVDGERHNIKGFESAANDTIPSKNSTGDLEYIPKTEVSGPAGPQGPPGTVPKVNVADLDDPAAELASQSGADGDSLFVYQTNDPKMFTLYIMDTVTSPTVNSPYVVQGTGGRWIASGGKYINDVQIHNGNITMVAGRTVDTRDVSVDGAKLDTIATGAQVNQNDATIKTQYENNSNTNAFTDAEKTKLGTVVTGANPNAALASQVEAEAGVENTKTMTALRTKQSIDKFAQPLLDIATSSFIDEEFIGGADDTDEAGALGWKTEKSGTGSLFEYLVGTANNPGIFRLRIPSGSAARAGMCLCDLVQHVVPTNDVRWRCVVRLGGDLNNHEQIVAGLGDNLGNADQNNGIYFEHLPGDTNWFLVTNNGGAKTRRDTTIAPTGVFQMLEFVKTGASIQARINNSDVGAAITTNLPTTAVSPIFQGLGDAAQVSAVDFDVDYMDQRLTGLTRF